MLIYCGVSENAVLLHVLLTTIVRSNTDILLIIQHVWLLLLFSGHE